MQFTCPGGCGKAHPLAAGLLVYEADTHVAVILCAPCTANLVLTRAAA